MKILKYLFYLTLGLVVIVLAVGLLKPSVSYGHKISVNKPIKEAWAVTQDESKFDQWLEGFKSIELISGEKNAVGSKYKVIVDPGEGQPEFEMIQTVASIKEFDHVTLSFDSDFMDFEQTISYSEENGLTTVETDSKVFGKNIITRAMFAIMEMFTGSFHAQETKNIEALKKLIEENTTDYYPAPNVIEEDMDSPN